MTITIRHAVREDADRIARLHAESWRGAYRGIYGDAYLDGAVFEERANVWRERMSAPARNQMALVADDAGTLAGFVCLFARKHVRWGSLIDNLHAAPDRKRSGIGTRLMREAAMWLRQEHADVGVYLWALDANAPARRFYERLGGRLAETEQHELPGGTIGASCRYAWESAEALLASCEL